MRRGLIAAFLVILTGCPSGTSGGAADASDEADAVDPRETLDRVDAYLTTRGWARMGPALHNPSVKAGGIVAYAVRANPNQCYAAVVIGQRARLETALAVVDPGGRRIEDFGSAGQHSWLVFCPERDGQHVVRIHNRKKAGGYFYSLYAGRRPDMEAPARFFSRLERETTGKPSWRISSQFKRIDRSLGWRGYERRTEPRLVQIAARSERAFPLLLRQGQCYAFATITDRGVTATWLVRNAERKTVLQAEDSVEENFCPTLTDRYELVVTSGDIGGGIMVGAWLHTGNGQPQREGDGEILGAEYEQDLEQRASALESEMVARGYLALDKRGKLNGAHRFEVELVGNRCYAVAVVGDERLAEVGMRLRSPGGAVLDEPQVSGRRVVARTCPATDGTLRAEVDGSPGTADLAYAVFEWPRGTHGPFNLDGVIYVRLAETTALLAYEGYQPSIDDAPQRGSLPRQGDQSEHRVRLEANQCYALVIVGGDGVYELDVDLSRNDQLLAADRDRSAFPSVRHCTTAAGEYRLAVRATRGAGDYVYQIFER